MRLIKNNIKNKPIAGFLFRVVFFYITWQILYDLFIFPDARLDRFLAVSVAFISSNILSFFGWDIGVWGRLIVIDGYRGVEVLNDCNGLTLMALYSGFIISFQGPNILRFFYILSGIGVIYLLNVIRIMAFSLATVYFQDYWNIFHEFSAFIFFYPIILIIWHQWTLRNEKNTKFS